jgi:hypothetical protein
MRPEKDYPVYEQDGAASRETLSYRTILAKFKFFLNAVF